MLQTEQTFGENLNWIVAIYKAWKSQIQDHWTKTLASNRQENMSARTLYSTCIFHIWKYYWWKPISQSITRKVI